MVWGLCGWLTLLGPSSAQAQAGPRTDASEPPSAESVDEDAGRHFQAATDAFQIADYTTARREYELAFELSGRPEVMYQLYLCDERLGDLDGAIRWLERYLLEAPDVPRRPVLLARLETMRERAAARDASPEPSPVTPPEPAPPLADPVTRPAPAAAPDPGPRDALLVSGGILLGVAALGFVASAVLGGLGLREQDRLAEECMFDVCPGALRTVASDADGLFLSADVLWIGSLVLTGAGIVTTLLGWLEEDTP